MVKMRLIVLMASCIVSAGGSLSAGQGGSSGMALRQINSVRAYGRGDAVCALRADAEALYRNPAGISCVRRGTVRAGFVQGITGDDGVGVIDVVKPLGEKRSWGASCGYYTGGDIELIASDGTIRTVQSQQDYLFSLAYAFALYSWPLDGYVSYGMKYTFLHSTMVQDFSAAAHAADVGVQFEKRELEKPVHSLGLSLQNAGSGLKYSLETNRLPLRLCAGYCRYYKRLQAEIDVVRDLNDERTRWHLGAAYSANERFLLRGGYKAGYDLESFTAGCSIAVGHDQSIDYAFGFMGTLGLRHLLSFEIKL